MDETKVAIIILAAGESKRLGKPKQLLKFQDQTLISRAVKTALDSKPLKVFVILGANAEIIKTEIEQLPVEMLINQNWQSGMASSIKCGIENLIEEINAVIIMLCDQPLIEIKHLNLLIETFEQYKKPIIAAKYKSTIGVPALFDRSMFSYLQKIEGDKGARQIIKCFEHLVETIEIPEAEFDVDTLEDFQKLKDQE